MPRPAEGDLGEALALLEAADRKAYGATDRTADGLREERSEVYLERAGRVVELDGPLAGYGACEDRRREELR